MLRVYGDRMYRFFDIFFFDIDGNHVPLFYICCLRKRGKGTFFHVKELTTYFLVISPKIKEKIILERNPIRIILLSVMVIQKQKN